MKIVIVLLVLLTGCTMMSYEDIELEAKGKPPKDTDLALIIDEAGGPIDIKISVSDTILYEKGKVTFKIVSKEIPQFYYWFIDGQEVDNNTDRLQLSGQDITRGNHRVDCVAEIDGRMGSDTVYFLRY